LPDSRLLFSYRKKKLSGKEGRNKKKGPRGERMSRTSEHKDIWGEEGGAVKGGPAPEKTSGGPRQSQNNRCLEKRERRKRDASDNTTQ